MASVFAPVVLCMVAACSGAAPAAPGGAYSYITVGGSNAPAELAQPLRETLYFAGEAANPGESGTVEAALQSGQRAAREIAKQFAK